MIYLYCENEMIERVHVYSEGRGKEAKTSNFTTVRSPSPKTEKPRSRFTSLLFADGGK